MRRPAGLRPLPCPAPSRRPSPSPPPAVAAAIGRRRLRPLSRPACTHETRRARRPGGCPLSGPSRANAGGGACRLLLADSAPARLGLPPANAGGGACRLSLGGWREGRRERRRSTALAGSARRRRRRSMAGLLLALAAAAGRAEAPMKRLGGRAICAAAGARAAAWPVPAARSAPSPTL